MNPRFKTGFLIYFSTKRALWRYFHPHVLVVVYPHKVFYDALTESLRRISLSQTSLRLNSSERKPPISSEQAPVDMNKNVETSLQGVLRRSGPIPLSRISWYLDDDSMEFLSTYAGGPMAFCSRYPKLFHVVILPNRINVLLGYEEFYYIPFVDRKMCMWVAAVLVTAFYMPKAIPLPVTPTTVQLYQYMQGNKDEVLLHGITKISQQELRLKLRYYNQLFVYNADRLCLARHRFILMGNTSEAVAQAMGISKKLAPPTISSSTTVFTHAFTPSISGAHYGSDRKSLIDFIKAHVPTTFFVPLTYLLQCPDAERTFGVDCTFEAVRASITDGDVNEFFCIQVLAPTLKGTYVRRLKPDDADCFYSEEDPSDEKRAVLRGAVTGEVKPQKHQPPEIAAQAYNIFSIGNKITQELIQFQTQSELNHIRLVKGVSMVELQSEILSKDLVKEIEGFLGADNLPNLGIFYLLIFDRLRHLFDVDTQQGCVRPWALLRSEEQPSSLTTTTTPLPLVLHSLQQQLSRGPLATSALYKNLSIFCRRQLLTLYHQDSWMQISRTALDTPDAISRGCNSLRTFVNKHSLYFVQRGDDLLCSSAYLATEVTKSVSFRSIDSDYPVQQRRKKITDFEMAEMIYNILPQCEPVLWRNFCTSRKVKMTLPFDALKLRKDFFNRFKSYFITCDAFFTNRLIVGRADCDVPPLDVLQPPLKTIESIIKFIALHAIGGVTEIEIMSALSKEGRVFMKMFGSCADLVKKLPEWFEVRRGIFHQSNSIITYIGSENNSLEEEDSYFAEFLPLRKKLNNASLATAPSDTTGLTNP
ncbi:unnamed protein product [Phytomonas sp. Hart1]|nr:unnamed protein product [Phytomonas sp. Hart1]|eukprot:CCW66268.1 unnamed protein product [Phytomonas sp. isolate Hart1]